jgi:hypothetical protein
MMTTKRPAPVRTYSSVEIIATRAVTATSVVTCFAPSPKVDFANAMFQLASRQRVVNASRRIRPDRRPASFVVIIGRPIAETASIIGSMSSRTCVEVSARRDAISSPRLSTLALTSSPATEQHGRSVCTFKGALLTRRAASLDVHSRFVDAHFAHVALPPRP